jgi:hypothetical protein
MGLTKRLFDIMDLLDMKRGQIFASGVCDKIIFGNEIKWVAVRLSIDEWAIFYAHKNTPDQDVQSHKRKLLADSLIKSLVGGTPRFYKKYSK